MLPTMMVYDASKHLTLYGVQVYKSMNISVQVFFELSYTDVLCINRNNMGASPDQWDNRMVDHLKNFDLSSPEVRQQFGK